MLAMTPPKQTYRLDLATACPAKGCLAPVGRECKKLSPGIVHFGRRMKRLLIEKKPR